MRFILLLLLPLMAFWGCGKSPEEQAKGERVQTLQGIALDAKAGAVLQTPDDHIYYIDSLSYWDDDLLGKWVEVKGESRDAFFIGSPEIVEDGAYVQSSHVKVRAIMRASWKLMSTTSSQMRN